MDGEFEKHLIEKNLEYLREYLDLIHSKVAQHAEELKNLEQKVFQKYVEGGGDPELYEDEGSLEDLAIEQFDSQQLMYRSFIVSLFMFMEQLTNDICTVLRINTKQLFTYKDITGQGISRSINYLTKVLGEHPVNDINTRENFEAARIVRNAIVHADGQLSPDNEKRLKKLIDSKRINLRIGYHDVEITHEYAESALEMAKCFGVELVLRIN